MEAPSSVAGNLAVQPGGITDELPYQENIWTSATSRARRPGQAVLELEYLTASICVVLGIYGQSLGKVTLGDIGESPLSIPQDIIICVVVSFSAGPMIGKLVSYLAAEVWLPANPLLDFVLAYSSTV